jgi:hypothetical protein
MSQEVKMALGMAGLAIAAILAFGVFGIHTAFTDDEVNEELPVFNADGASGFPSDDVSSAIAEQMTEEMVGEERPIRITVSEDMPQMDEGSVEQIVTLATGSFIDRSHPGSGTAEILGNGTSQRFLRLADDFATDNGPDLNVYLSAGVTADGDAGMFDDDFYDLGDLKGNIGAQNYEIPESIDIETYDTVVVWCVRFGVAFTAADLS